MPEFTPLRFKDPKEGYRLLIGAVVPRPIALVSTLSATGSRNLAPFSFFNVVCYNPMILAFFPLRFKQGEELKDTVTNIKETGEFVISVVTEAMAPAVNACSGKYAHGVDEFEVSGLTPVPSRIVRPFRVKESPVQFECRLHKMIPFGEGEGGCDAVFGEVVQIGVDEAVMDGSRIDIGKLNPVARLAGAQWSTIGKIFELERP
jgi:flavin reductase (DIM6/NTAB) family NADH-FMN oxidoreductase RutF